MKVCVLQENLDKGLDIALRGISQKPIKEILRSVMVETEADKLKLTSTNIDLTVSCWVAAEVKEHGKLLIPAKLTAEVISVLPNDKVDLTLIEGEKSVKVKCGSHTSRLSLQPLDQFPIITKPLATGLIKVQANKFRELLARVYKVPEPENGQVIFTGVNFNFVGNTLTATATDSIRLAVATMTLAKELAEPSTFMLRANIVDELFKLMPTASTDTELIEISMEGPQITFKFGSVEISALTLSAKYPDVLKLIPGAFATQVTVDSDTFGRAIRACAIFAGDISKTIRLSIKEGTISVVATGQEIGENTSEMEACVDGPGLSVGLNAKFVIEFLGGISEKQVVLNLNSSKSPVVMAPKDSSTYRYLLMPVAVISA